jgi:hypothetical protein
MKADQLNHEYLHELMLWLACLLGVVWMVCRIVVLQQCVDLERPKGGAVLNCSLVTHAGERKLP